MQSVTSMAQKSSAYLEIILGSMFSGKTSRLVEIFKQCTFCNIPIIVINHANDDRYDNMMLSTHDRVKIPCMKTENLMDLFKKEECNNCIENSEVILVNEGQFFTDLYEFVELSLKKGKKIYVCGLDGDFERKKFGQILDLIPLCDKVTKLNSLCSQCRNGKKGIFSCRITNETTQVVIGSDNYKPLCRSCYLQSKI
jgi:thymidine kinase